MMMVDMEMEMEMEIEDNEFVCDEIDFDYEFDAARFFDFTAPETTAQARQAETWFQTAGSYCPSRSFFLSLFCTFICTYIVFVC